MRASRESKWMGAPASPPVVVLGTGLAGPPAVRRLGRAGVRRARLLTFPIVGAGAAGVEMAGALAEFRRHVVPRDYRTVDPAELRLVVLEAGEHVLPPYPAALRARARRDLEAFGVEVLTGRRVERVAGDHVEPSGGERLSPATVIWAAG